MYDPSQIHPYLYTVYQVPERGKDERLAEAMHADVAIAAFEACLKTRSLALIELRNGARVMRSARTGPCEDGVIETVWRST